MFTCYFCIVLTSISQTGLPLTKNIDNFGEIQAGYTKQSVSINLNHITSLFLRKLLLVSMLYGPDIYKKCNAYTTFGPFQDIIDSKLNLWCLFYKMTSQKRFDEINHMLKNNFSRHKLKSKLTLKKISVKIRFCYCFLLRSVNNFRHYFSINQLTKRLLSSNFNKLQ